MDECIVPRMIALSLHRFGNGQTFSLYISEDMQNFSFADRKLIHGDCGILCNPDKLKCCYIMITVEHTANIYKGMLPINSIKIV